MNTNKNTTNIIANRRNTSLILYKIQNILNSHKKPTKKIKIILSKIEKNEILSIDDIKYIFKATARDEKIKAKL